jgi:predicted ATPase
MQTLEIKQVLEEQPIIQSPTKLHTLSSLRLEQTNFTRPKPLLLLTYLCLEGKQEKRFLAELFWQGASNHLNSLAKALSQLRQVGVIDNDDAHAWATVPNDIKEFFEALERRDFENAVTLYQSSFLSGFYLPDWGIELEEWVYSTREYLAARMREALLELAEKSDDTTTAMKYAERAYELTATLEPDLLPRLYKFLANTPHATKLKQEAEEYGVELLAKEQTKTISFNLLSRGTSFIGRDIERLELGELLSQPDVRLLTIVGQGGVGKTRLALEVAREAKEDFRDGVVFIPLESFTTSEQAISSFSSIFGVTLDKCDDVVKIAEAIGDKHLLILLDNFEHLLEMSPRLSQLLRECPNLKILVTSRARLELEEEWLYRLEGFSLPSEVSLAVAQLNDAVTLFAQRARKVKQGFTLTLECLPFVLNICKRVEGLPLGIELAASWAKVLSCQEIAENLEDLDFLATSLNNVPERQQSLRVVFEGSWSLLSKEEQSALRKLSVFRAGFTGEAARKIVGASLMMLARLVDKSLLRASDGRYDQHPLLRTFTEEKLSAPGGEQAETRAAHAAYFLALAEEAEPHLTTAQQVVWFDCLELELGNLRAALEWFLEANALEEGFNFAHALYFFWARRGHSSEVRVWLSQALARPGTGTLARANALERAGTLAFLQGDYAPARAFLDQALALARRLGAKACMARALGTLGACAGEEGHYRQSQRYCEESLALFRELQDVRGMALIQHNLGILALEQGNVASARKYFEDSLPLYRSIGSQHDVAWTLNSLAEAAWVQGEVARTHSYAEEALALSGDPSGLAFSHYLLASVATVRGERTLAHRHFRESLTLQRQAGNKHWLIISLEGFAEFLRSDDTAQAVRLLGAADQARTVVGVPRPPLRLSRYKVELTRVRETLGEETFAAAWARGQVLTLEQAVSLALQHEAQTVSH